MDENNVSASLASLRFAPHASSERSARVNYSTST